jgi:hypothetical protein
VGLLDRLGFLLMLLFLAEAARRMPVHRPAGPWRLTVA